MNEGNTLTLYRGEAMKTRPYSDSCLHPADGFALGAAVATGQVTVQVVIFLAVGLHKVSFQLLRVKCTYSDAKP